MKRITKIICTAAALGMLQPCSVSAVTPDLNSDGMINAQDAALVLQYAAMVGAGIDMTIEEFAAANAVSKPEPWKDAYLAHIDSLAEYADKERMQYTLVDVDGDGTPELDMLDAQSGYGGFYTYHNDEVIMLTATAVRRAVNPTSTKGVFVVTWTYSGRPYSGYEVYRLSDGEAVLIEDFEYEAVMESGVITEELYTINDAPVTQEEYENRFAAYRDTYVDAERIGYADLVAALKN